jgi:peptidyl-prolyl cis-trans isomerase-like protein 2
VDRLKYVTTALIGSIKIKNWKDLMDETPFKRSDIITLQDPKNIANKSINEFHYIKQKIAPEKAVVIKGSVGNNASIDRIMSEISTAPTPSFVKQAGNQAGESNSKASMSFTSSGISVETRNDAVSKTDVELMFVNMDKGKRGVAMIQTNIGGIEVELYASETPMTCYNFIMLSKRGDYKGVKVFIIWWLTS